MKKTSKHLLSLLTVCMFFVLAVASSDDKKKEKEVAEKEVTQPAIEVTAKQLYADYEANGVAADLKYKDKVLAVTGTVDDISKGLGDDIYVTLNGAEYAGDIQCFFSKDHESEAAQLKKGQQITIKGNCEGMLGNVLLRGCSIK